MKLVVTNCHCIIRQMFGKLKQCISEYIYYVLYYIYYNISEICVYITNNLAFVAQV